MHLWPQACKAHLVQNKLRGDEPVTIPAKISQFMSARTLLLSAGLSAMMLAGTPTAFAAGGGGGGGSAPSQSAPRYDPAEEYRLGVEALNAEEFSTAIKHFKRVTREAKRDPASHYLLGVSYMRNGDTKKARKPLERAVKYAPDMIQAQRDLALVYLGLDQGEDAMSILASLKERQSSCADQCSDKAALSQAVSAIENALGSGEVLSHFGPNISSLAHASQGDATYAQAVGLINQGQYEDALVSLRQASIAFGPHPDILTYQGFANRKLQRYQVAEGYYKQALSIAPDHLGALEYYGELKVERGDMAGARAHLAALDRLCSFGCYEAEELRNWIKNGQS
jgi:Flp pilus assembly protein TadD